MEIAISAAGWVIGRALGPVSDGLLESWAASSELGTNVSTLKLELLYAQGMLNNAHGRDVRNPALGQMLLELRGLAYRADDVLDELDYFRIQDELEGSFDTTDADDRGLVGGLFFNARHTAKDVAHKLSCASSSSGAWSDDDADEQAGGCCNCHLKTTNQEADHVGGCMPMVISSARNTVHAVGKRLSCYSPASKAQPTREHVVRHAPKLKFDRVGISKRMKDIIEQLKPICAKVATILELELLGPNSTAKQGTSVDRPKTTPEILEPKLYGRDHQKKGVVDDIITHGKYRANDLTVLSIVGPGGIGKTKFTQHIYEEVKNHFDVPIWICVSLNFNADRLAHELVKDIPKVEGESGNASDRELIQVRLQSKRFLLVLDDMWTYHEDEWKKLLALFRKGGTKGNMVIVTTRFPKVANMVAKEDCLKYLGRLEEEDCMQFFQACVLDEKQSWEDLKDLYEVGKNIVKKLKGYPLAVKTVSRLLRNQRTSDYWKRVLDSKEWELQTDENDIMPALKLSYIHLPFHLQQCFSHCSLFPEDYEFETDELIHLWIGLGLLSSSDENKSVEDTGLDNLKDLVNYGFFQKNDKKNVGHCFVIHDLLHELAINVSSYECLSVHASNVSSIYIPASIRHLSITVDDTEVKDRMTFDNCKEELSMFGKRLRSENLRTLMLFGEHHGSFSKTFGDLFSKARSLRVIFLSGASYKLEAVLHNFSNLIHLRYLRIKADSFTEINLPISVSRFYHLMVLDLKHCEELSASLRDMRNLVKIRHLLVPREWLHSEIFEVGKLKSLQELRVFEINKEMSGFELRQLGQLPQLQGSLRIHNLERVEATEKADEAKLEKMKHLHRLTLEWNSSRANKDLKLEQDVLESLKPNSNLQELCIKGHGGATCPTWLRVDVSLKKLENICLDDVAWKSFPPLGELWMVSEHGEEWQGCCVRGPCFQNLKRIQLVAIQTLKKWCGNDTYHLFPLLEVLVVGYCPQLIELPFSHFTASSPAEQDETATRFPKLREIVVSDCPRLLSLPPIPWTRSLDSVKVFGVGTCQYINYKKNELSVGSHAPDSQLCTILAFNNLGEIEEFEIDDCPLVPLQHMQMLTCLKSLRISNSSNFLWPVEGESNAMYKFSVEYLSISNCGATGKELTQLFSYFPNLSKLRLYKCGAETELGVVEKQGATTRAPSPIASHDKTQEAKIKQQQQQAMTEVEIEAVAEGIDGLMLLPSQLPQLQELQIKNCPDMRLCSCSVDDRTTGRQGLEGLVSLQRLTIDGCPKFLSSGSSSSLCPFPVSLEYLSLSGLECMFSLTPLTNLTRLEIRDCGNLRWEGIWHLLAQDHLIELEIYGCPNIFAGSEPSRMRNENLSRLSRLQVLRTDDRAGILAVPLCARLFSSITKLSFQYNDDIESFSKEQEAALQSLRSLKELQIQLCSKLQSMPAGLRALPNLKRLEILYCNAIRSFPKDGLPNSLMELKISFCPSIQSLPKDGLPNSLMELKIYECAAIRSLPKGSLPSSLQTLDVGHWLYSTKLKRQYRELKGQCRKLQGTIPVVRI